MSNNFFYLLIILFIFSCDRAPYKPRMLSKIEKSKQTRSISSSDEVQCLKDKFNVNSLREDIFELEQFAPREYFRTRNSAPFLASLKPQELYYVNNFYEWINQNNNFSGCENIMCILNRSQNLDDNNISGFVIYYFYLKTGYPISTSNNSPNLNYIRTMKTLNDQELKIMWEMAQTFPDSMKNMSRVRSINKFDNKDKLLAPGTSREVCTLAADGFLPISENCNYVTYPQNLYNNYFHEVVFHELAHDLDFTLGEFSHTDEWRSISGWDQIELIAPNGNYQMHMDASKVLDKESFITDYGATNPLEDFAESMTRFRLFANYKDPSRNNNKVKETIPWKFKKIREKFYNNRSFTEEDTLVFYKNKIINNLLYETSSIIQNCMNTQETFESEPIKINFELQIPSSNKRCIESKAFEKIKKMLREINLSELEGCEVTNKYKNEILLDVANKISPQVNRYISQNDTANKIVNSLNEFKNNMREKLDVKEIIISCINEKDPQNCYNENLDKEVNKISEPYKDFLKDILENEINIFKTSNDYTLTKKQVLALFSDDIAKISDFTKQKADSIWNECKNNTEDSEVVTLTPFDGGDQYIVSSILKCINNNFDNKIIENIPLKYEDDRYILFLRREVLIPNIIKYLNESVFNDSKEEVNAFKTIKETKEKELSDKLIINFDWIKENNTKESCERSIDVELSKATFDTYKFIEINFQKNLIKDDVCKSVISKVEEIKKAEEIYLKTNLTEILNRMYGSLSQQESKWKIQPFNKENIFKTCFEMSEIEIEKSYSSIASSIVLKFNSIKDKTQKDREDFCKITASFEERTFNEEKNLLETQKDNLIDYANELLKRNKIKKPKCPDFIKKNKAKLFSYSGVDTDQFTYIDVNVSFNTWIDEICNPPTN